MKPIAPLLALLALAACRPEAEIPDDPPPLPVKIEKAARAPFQPTLVLLGVVRPAKEAEVVLPSSGRLRYPERFRNGLSSGTPVQAGEVLARLVNTDTESGVAEAKLRLAAATSDLARYQKAFDSGVVPAATLATYKAEADLAAQRLEAARQKKGTLELRSPVAGWLLVERQLPPEGEVQAGAVLARVAAGGPPRVEAKAAAGDRGRLHPGLRVRFVLPGREEVVGPDRGEGDTARPHGVGQQHRAVVGTVFCAGLAGADHDQALAVALFGAHRHSNRRGVVLD